MGAAPPFRIRWYSVAAIVLILGLAVNGFVQGAWVLGFFELGVIGILILGLWTNHRIYTAALARVDEWYRRMTEDVG